MKKLFPLLVICVCFALHASGQNPSPVKVRVLKDNTNLRAKPALNVEVAGQMSANQELTIKSMDAEWVEVVPPAHIDFWVLGDYLKDGVVVCRQAVNVRAGPGINFSIVGQLANNVRVDVRGSHAEWVKIAPPESCSLWVSRSLVALEPPTPVSSPAPTTPAKPAPAELAATRPPELAAAEPPAKPGPMVQAVPSAPREPEKKEMAASVPATNLVFAGKPGAVRPRGDELATISPPPDLDLIPDVPQGQWKQFAGALRRKNFIVRSPSDFRLVAEDKDGTARTVCFVKGNRAQLDALLFRELIISGRQYWVRRHSYPVLVPEKIILK